MEKGEKLIPKKRKWEKWLNIWRMKGKKKEKNSSQNREDGKMA